MTVDVADARYRTVHDGRTYYFCSAGCLGSFESDPARYTTGAAAQLSRGLLPEISKKLTQEFADCLQESMAAEQITREGVAAADAGLEPPATATAPSETAPMVAKPVGGLRLGLAAIWSIVT